MTPTHTPINPNDGGWKGYHNYYTREEFFRRNPDEGTIHLRDGQRAAAVSEDFINGLHNGLQEDVG
jgi:hypothetical protein